MDSEKSLIVFHNNKIRRIWHDDEWNYSVSDIIAVLTDSKDELAYWRKLKQREPQLGIISGLITQFILQFLYIWEDSDARSRMER